MGKGLALDIGGTKIAAAVVTESGMLIGRQQIATPRGGAGQLAAALETLIAPYRHQVDFIAVASTGIISGGRLTALNPANLGGLADFPLYDCIRSISDLPCVLLNDGQAAAWAEYQALGDKNDNMMFVTVSTGVGGGIILNKNCWSGNVGWQGISAIRCLILMVFCVVAVAGDVSRAWHQARLLGQKPWGGSNRYRLPRCLTWRSKGMRRREKSLTVLPQPLLRCWPT
ncbi:ROK family protein [Yersinia pestis KIM D27]|nr:ROK family protein [Yersinia pestis KIM D27]